MGYVVHLCALSLCASPHPSSPHPSALPHPCLQMGDMMGQVGLLAIVLNSLRKAYGVFDSSKGAGTANTVSGLKGLCLQ